MYECPIAIFQNRMEHNIRESVDGTIYEAVLKIGVHVDRDELLRALRYDRDQYAKGYEDGKRDAERHGRWGEYEVHPLARSLDGYPCTACGQHEQRITSYCPNCGAKMDEEDEA